MDITFFYILIAIIFCKFLLFIFLFPLQCFLYKYRKKKSIINKVFAIPGFIIERITRGGAARFLIYNLNLLPSTTIRKLCYKLMSVSIKSNVVFHFRTELRAPEKLSIGKGSIIGDNVILDARNGLIIGDNVNISSNVSIYTEQHDYRDEYFRCNCDNKSVVLGNRVWIGCNVVILPGVKIGEGSVCCAGSVVTKDVEPYSVVAGIPAHKINNRPRDLKYNFTGKPCWFY